MFFASQTSLCPPERSGNFYTNEVGELCPIETICQGSYFFSYCHSLSRRLFFCRGKKREPHFANRRGAEGVRFARSPPHSCGHLNRYQTALRCSTDETSGKGKEKMKWEQRAVRRVPAGGTRRAPERGWRAGPDSVYDAHLVVHGAGFSPRCSQGLIWGRVAPHRVDRGQRRPAGTAPLALLGRPQRAQTVRTIHCAGPRE